jgi:Cu+-exporting ATPase
VVEVRKDGNPAGWFVIEDPVRSDSAQAVNRLKESGILPVMATGDNERTARAVARQVGITHLHAGVRPENKLDIVRGYQTEGKKVMMIGDGMNDAAALKGADIGIAVGSGMDLAIDSADVVIVTGGLSKVVSAISISRRTFRIIGQNLFWAFLYNVVSIPLAMAGLLHPAIAEAAMAFSSISVVLNSMRIKGKEA